MNPQCSLDKTIINDETILELTDLSRTFFADLCGRNRGAMILPNDNHTYGCTVFPEDFALRAGMGREFPLANANDIQTSFAQKNITGAETIAVLDYFVQNIYTSSPKVEEDPYACNVAGLATLECGAADVPDMTLRAATLAGLFTYVPWATKGTHLTLEQAKGFYTPSDFEDMKHLGLNAVQIPIPHSIFHSSESHWLDLLTSVLAMVSASSMQAILVLSDGDEGDVSAAARYAGRQSAVLGLTVPSKHAVASARDAAPKLNLLVPVLQDDLKHFDKNHDPHIFAALDLGHTGTVADVASSSSAEDRSKLFYHESLSCLFRSPLEFAACYKDTQVFVAKGFDIAIDDCVNKTYNPDFHDYGQCGRFHETVDSPWWEYHRKSFFDRQRFSYEKGLGWSYAAWKLYEDDKHTTNLDHPESLLSLKDLAAAGLVKNLRHTLEYSKACLNPPTADFILGDATLAPVPAPPPDCGNGWWNESIHDCTYWVPPVTIPPTPCPTCPEVEACPAPNTLLIGGVAGVLGLIIGAVIGRVENRRRQGYQEVSVVV